MGGLLLNLIIVFADAERRIIADRVQQGIYKARRDGKRVDRPPAGYDVDDDGFLYQDPAEYAKVQNFIRGTQERQDKDGDSGVLWNPAVLDSIDPEACGEELRDRVR